MRIAVMATQASGGKYTHSIGKKNNPLIHHNTLLPNEKGNKNSIKIIKYRA